MAIITYLSNFAASPSDGCARSQTRLNRELNENDGSGHRALHGVSLVFGDRCRAIDPDKILSGVIICPG
jgi:hypothetical protein